MTGPNYADFTDTSRPRPVRVTAFLATLATAVLAVLTATEVLSSAVAGSLLGVVTILGLGGWLFVEQKVTPVSSPAAVTRDGTLVPLVEAATPGAPPPNR